MDCHHADGEWVDLERVEDLPPLHQSDAAQHRRDHLDEVAYAHQQPRGDAAARVERLVAHRLRRPVEGCPVVLGLAVRDDVELAEALAAGEELLLRNDQAVAVIVHIGEVNDVLAAPEDAQLVGARRVHQVGQEQRVPRAVHLVRRDRHDHEGVAASLVERHLCHGLGLGIGCEVLALLRHHHLLLAHPRQVPPVHARRGGARVDELADLVPPAGLDEVEGTLVVDLFVEGEGVKGPHNGRDVEDAVDALARLEAVVEVCDVALHPLDARVIGGEVRLWSFIKRHHPLRTTLHKHLA
mmetsp:Transcript_16545/g.41837  ORF Transcript_16545/g.41837 Transcript_16545/m.41837 type:complete len:297 (-) Transcript_16545:64-954(-)